MEFHSLHISPLTQRHSRASLFPVLPVMSSHPSTPNWSSRPSFEPSYGGGAHYGANYQSQTAATSAAPYSPASFQPGYSTSYSGAPTYQIPTSSYVPQPFPMQAGDGPSFVSGTLFSRQALKPRNKSSMAIFQFFLKANKSYLPFTILQSLVKGRNIKLDRRTLIKPLTMPQRSTASSKGLNTMTTPLMHPTTPTATRFGSSQCG